VRRFDMSVTNVLISIGGGLAVLSASMLTAISCAPSPAQYEVSDLAISPAAVEVYGEVTIRASVTNTGGVAGNYTASLSIGGCAIDAQAVTLAPGASTELAFHYMPETKGNLTVEVGEASGILLVTEPPPGEWWDVHYLVVESNVSQRMCIQKTMIREYSFQLPEGTSMDIRISKTIVNGSREVFLGAAGFRSDPMVLKNVFPGIDSTVTWALAGDAVGTLCVADDAGDVDVFATSTSGAKPATAYVIGDSAPDPAGSLQAYLPMSVEFESLGISSMWSIDAYITTGHSYSYIDSPDRAIDGSKMEGDGEPCSRDGGIVPYVGAPCTIVLTGAIIDRRIFGVYVDVQFMAEMRIAPIVEED